MKSEPLILAFDVFGTVVDWHGSISREVAALIPGEDGDAFATAWRAGYKPAMAEVRSGQLGWTKIDDLHRRILDQVLKARGHDLDEGQRQHLNRAWHRLAPWPDTIAGMQRLKAQFTLCTLSNGNLSLLAHMASSSCCMTPAKPSRIWSSLERAWGLSSSSSRMAAQNIS